MPTPKIIAIMPADNASKTLERTFREIPRDTVHECIVVDDFSADSTVEVAHRLGLRVFLHRENQGPALVPPIVEDRADLVLGSRMAYAIAGGMPSSKQVSNRFLTWWENKVFGLTLSEYHTGFRAFRRSLLESTPFFLNSNVFIFDQEIVARAVWFGARLEEMPDRYFPEASTIGFRRSFRYGLGVLALLATFLLNRKGLISSRMFRPLHHFYSEVAASVSRPGRNP